MLLAYLSFFFVERTFFTASTAFDLAFGAALGLALGLGLAAAFSGGLLYLLVFIERIILESPLGVVAAQDNQ